MFDCVVLKRVGMCRLRFVLLRGLSKACMGGRKEGSHRSGRRKRVRGDEKGDPTDPEGESVWEGDEKGDPMDLGGESV